MKTFVSFIVLAFATSIGFAQAVFEPTGHIGLINRADHQQAILQVEPTPSAQVTPQEKKFVITLLQPRLVLGRNDYGSIIGSLKNLTTEPIDFIFKREMNRVPDYESDSGWKTGVCFGSTCYLNEVDSLLPNQAYTLEGGAETELKLNVIAVLDADDTILVHILLTGITGSGEDTAGVWMTAISRGEAAVAPQIRSGRPTIASIFPNPLISGNSIKVSVSTRADVGYRYTIYDPFGREVAFGTSQHKLAAGDNIFSIGSLEDMASGSYLLKLTFSDGSSDAYPFTVVR